MNKTLLQQFFFFLKTNYKSNITLDILPYLAWVSITQNINYFSCPELYDFLNCVSFQDPYLGCDFHKTYLLHDMYTLKQNCKGWFFNKVIKYLLPYASDICFFLY